MAEPGELHRFPQSKSVDAVRWLATPSAIHRLLASAVRYPSPSLEIHTLLSPSHDADDRRRPSPSLHLLSSHPLPSPMSALRLAPSPSRPLPAAVATLAASLHLLFIDPIEGSVQSELSVSADPSFHRGPISDVDMGSNGRECVTVGEDGRVNVVVVGEGRLERVGVHDSKGLVAHTAARWGSPAEFATGGLGFGVQWWDRRRPGGSVAQFKGNWSRGSVSGMVHSIDIHPSRKHICVVGGSSGSVFAWDLRWQQQPILLSGVGLSGTAQPACESEVWEIQYDSQKQSSGISAASSTKILPVMMCSEDGILAVLEQGEEPVELLAEPCAINAFDIDPQNPSDVVCALEWETIGLLLRERDTLLAY